MAQLPHDFPKWSFVKSFGNAHSGYLLRRNALFASFPRRRAKSVFTSVRRRWDLNPCTVLPAYSLSRGASWATWVLLLKFTAIAWRAFKMFVSEGLIESSELPEAHPPIFVPFYDRLLCVFFWCVHSYRQTKIFHANHIGNWYLSHFT